jgi:hypothetical protein
MARRDDANHFRLSDKVYDEEESPVLSHSEDSFPRFIVSRRIQKFHKRIEKNLTGLVEPDSVLGKVEVRLLHVPAKPLACVEEMRVH